MALDMIETNIYKSTPEKPKKNIPKYRISLPFVNKAMYFINLPKLLHCQGSKSSMPSVMNDNDIPMIVYSLTQPIKSRILNYKRFVSELNLDEFLENKYIVKCNCSNYSRIL